MDYLIIKSRILDEVTILVNRHLAEGWEIVGGVACNNYFYCQAMVKPDENKHIAGYKKITPEMLKDLPDPRGPRENIVVSSTTGDPVKRSHKKKT